MAKKNEADLIRFKKVHVKRILGNPVGKAQVTGTYPNKAAAKASAERGKVMTPTQASIFINKINSRIK